MSLTRTNVMFKMRVFPSNDIEYNIDEEKLNSRNRKSNIEEINKAYRKKRNRFEQMIDYDHGDKATINSNAISGVYGANIGGSMSVQIHNNNFEELNTATKIKSKVAESQKDNNLYSRFIISQKHWSDFYDNYLVANKDGAEINTWQISQDFNQIMSHYHKQLYIKKYNRQNNLFGGKQVTLNTKDIQTKLKTVGYDPKNLNYYYSQHTNTDNPHFHMVMWDPNIKDEEGYKLYPDQLSELRLFMDRKLYRENKWKQLNEITARKNFTLFNENLNYKSKYDLLQTVIKFDFSTFRYQYLNEEQKEIIDAMFLNNIETEMSDEQNIIFKNKIKDLKKYYRTEYNILKLSDKTKEVYIEEKIQEFLKPYKQKILNEMKEITTTIQKNILDRNTKKINGNINKFIKTNPQIEYLFLFEMNEENIQRLEYWLDTEDYHFETRIKFLNSYFHKHISDKEILKETIKKYYKKYKIKNNLTSKVIQILEDEKVERPRKIKNLLSFFNENNLSKFEQHKLLTDIKYFFDKTTNTSYEKNLNRNKISSSQITKELYRVLLRNKLKNKFNTDNKIFQNDIQKLISKIEEDGISEEIINNNNLSITNFNLPEKELLDYKDKTKLIFNLDVSKDVKKWMLKQEPTEEKILELREYLIFNQFELSQIEKLEKTFLFINKECKNYTKLNEKINSFWRKDLNEFVTTNPLHKKHFEEDNLEEYIEFITAQNYSKNLMISLLKNFDYSSDNIEKMLEEKSIKFNEDNIQLVDSLSYTMETKNQIMKSLVKDENFVEKMNNEFSKYLIEENEKILWKEKINLLDKEFVPNKKIKKTILPMNSFLTDQLLDDMERREQELINNLSRQMRVHEK